MNSETPELAAYPLERIVEELLPKPVEVSPTELTRDFYLDLAEPFVRVAAEHQDDSGAIIDPYWDEVESPTGTARFVGAASVLIGAGRCAELVEPAAKGMDVRTEAIHRSMVTGERLPAADFETRDLMLGVRFLSEHVEDRRAAQWRQRLGSFDPEETYVDVLAQREPEKIYNWNVYALCGEWLKFCDGIADNRQWIDQYLPLQFRRFTEHGLYRDPHCPFTYDLTVRQGFSWMFATGYEGEHAAMLSELLRRGALTMLLYLSPLGQAPYGGRSNQFHHNEAMAACICEYEAARHTREGNADLAAVFKRQARLCAQATAPWLLDVDPPRHLKNRYAPETRRGCDNYGHYLVYGCLASNLFGVAYLMADESIEERATPAEIGGALLHLPDEESDLGGFHKVFASCHGYHVEIDTNGQPGEDATGLGRLHRLGVPSWVGPSSSSPASPHFVVGVESQERGASLCVAWREPEGEWRCLSELAPDERQTELTDESAHLAATTFEFEHRVAPGITIVETYELTDEGLTVDVKSDSELAALGLVVPVPVFDGERPAEMESTPTTLTTKWEEGAFHLECLDGDSHLALTEDVVENRNGALAVYRVEGNPFGVQVRLSLTPAGSEDEPTE